MTKGSNYNILIFIVEFPKREDIFTFKQGETVGHSVFRLRENPWWYFIPKTIKHKFIKAVEGALWHEGDLT